MFTKRGKILCATIAALMTFIVIHHLIIHDGVPYQYHDFENAIWNIIKSHEGLIVILSVAFVAIFVDDWNRSKKKRK